jgi:hypothetical protein
MTDRDAPTRLEFGEDLSLLRFALPPLGLLMVAAGAGGWFIGQVNRLRRRHPSSEDTHAQRR